MVNLEYVKEILPVILGEDSDVNTEVMAAISYYENHNEELFHTNIRGYDGAPKQLIEDTFEQVMNDLEIVVEKETELDIGEDSTVISTLEDVNGEELRFSLREVYDDRVSDDFFLSIDETNKLGVAAGEDNGELADAISDATEFMVQTVYYHLEYDGKVVERKATNG